MSATKSAEVIYHDDQPGRMKKPPLLTLVFITFILINMFVFMGFDILLPTLTLYLEQNGANKIEIGYIFATFTVSAVVMRMFAGRLARRFSPFKLARLGLLICAFAGGFYYVAHSTPNAMLARLLHGAGFGLGSTLLTALATQVIPPSRMGEGLGYLGLGTTVALALGPFLGVWLVNDFGYLTMFMVVAACYVISLLAVSFLPKIKLPPLRPGASKPKLVLIEPKLFAPSFLAFLIGTIIGSIMIYLALFCKEKNLPYVAHFFIFSTVGIFMSRLFAGRIYDRYGHEYVLLPGTVLLIISMFMLVSIKDLESLFMASIVYGLSSGAVFPAVQALVLNAAPTNMRTEATASFFNSFDLGIGGGALLLGLLADHFGTYRAVFFGAGASASFFLLFYVVRFIIIKPKKKVWTD